MFVADLLAGHRILITGGGTGLGKSIGRRYLELGAEIAICGRRMDVLAETAAEHKAATSGKVSFFGCDLRDPIAVDTMLDRVWNEGPLTGLVNNAAGNFLARTETLSNRAFDAVVNTVLHGTAYCTIGVGRRWIARGSPGTIISIVTSAAQTGRAYQVPSAAAKAGVLAIMRSLAVEWGPKNIRTVAVSPGHFPTEATKRNLRPDELQRVSQTNEVPLGRLGQNIELANLMCYLMSDEASYINGDCITIDGGRMLFSGGGAGVSQLAGWTEEQWEKTRPEKKP